MRKTSNKGSPVVRKGLSRRMSMELSRQKDEEIAKFILNQVSEINKRNSSVVQVLIERLKSPKIAVFDYTDEYSREWFKTVYHLNKNLKLDKLNISADTIIAFLKKVGVNFCLFYSNFLNSFNLDLFILIEIQ